MRDLLTLSRFESHWADTPPNCSIAGSFLIPSPATGATLRIIASAAIGWDHVSVSTKKRCPNWLEMSRVKDLFFWPHECVMQLHVPEDDHVNTHAFCLHLWRPHDLVIPRPPSLLVGVKGMTQAEARAMSPEQRMAVRRDMLTVLEREQTGVPA